MALVLNVNGKHVEVDADPMDRLSRILRDDLGLIGLKEGCCEGECGACTVLMDGLPIHACLMLGCQAEDHEITTVEALCHHGTLSDLQEAFVAHGAVQCGYCTPGMVMSAEGLLRRNRMPTENEIRRALAGNICRCTGFDAIVRTVATVAARRSGIGDGEC